MANCDESTTTGVRLAREEWGTVITVDVRDAIDERAVDACYAWFRRVDELFSTWRPDTEIMRIVAGTLAVEEASPEVGHVLQLCEDMRLESHGAFDVAVGAHPDVPRRLGFAPLDPSGLVKGWAVGQAAILLREWGAENFFITAGGDLVAFGRPDTSAPGWRVGVQHPWDRDRVAAVLEVSGRAVATSGAYERGEHVFDPRTGRPVSGLASVTVVGPDLAVADAYATASMVLGPDAGLRWLQTRVGYEGLAITDDHVVLTTPGIDRYRCS